jgi:hypothetical protein
LIAALIEVSLWSAPAERSGDGALDQKAGWLRLLLNLRTIQSGVALRLPPHSKNKNRSTSKKGWNGHEQLFLPSTVLTVSGSWGL